MKNDIKC